jgi:erythromycin esterase-like protein
MSTLSNARLRAESANPESNPPVQDDRLQLLRALLADREWSCDPLTRARLERMAADLGSSAKSGIDEAAWALLAEETQRYLDYRRLGALEALLRGCARTDFRFSRDDWAMARIAEAELHAQFRHVRDSSYVPEPSPMFRIH